MRIALLTHGTRGDVQPFIALGKGLAACGHDVLLAAPDEFAAWIEGHGLEFRSAGVNFHDFLQSPDAQKIMTGNVVAMARNWRRTIVPTIRNTLDATWAAARHAELIVYHPKAGGAVDVAEATGATLVCAAPFPIFPTSAFPFFVFSGDYGPFFNRFSYRPVSLPRVLFRRVVNRWREEVLGLGGDRPVSPRRNSQNDLELRLCAVSQAVIPRLYEGEEGTHATGYWFLDEEQDWQPNPALGAFLKAGSPPIYIGLGSVTTANPAQLASAVVEGVQRANTRAIIATGWGGLETANKPGSIHVINAAPHDVLFKHVKAVVHHGGAGTTATSLRAACPTLVCHQNFDQAFWGRRVWAIGCGPRPLPLKTLTGDRLAKALTDLIRTEAYRTHAVEIAQKIASDDGISRAIELIEAAHREPGLGRKENVPGT